MIKPRHVYKEANTSIVEFWAFLTATTERNIYRDATQCRPPNFMGTHHFHLQGQRVRKGSSRKESNKESRRQRSPEI